MNPRRSELWDLHFTVLAAGIGTGATPGERTEACKLFPKEAQVIVESGGLSRLVLPLEVLAECKPDLSDLRLFDVRGAEVPVDDPRPISFDVDGARLESLELIVENGNDAPLALRAVEARARTPRLFLAAPEGEYELLLGAPDETRPLYELERVRQVVLTVQAVATDMGDLEQNPAYAFRARLGGRRTGPYALMWVALVAAVAVLAILTLGLARR